MVEFDNNTLSMWIPHCGMCIKWVHTFLWANDTNLWTENEHKLNPFK